MRYVGVKDTTTDRIFTYSERTSATTQLSDFPSQTGNSGKVLSTNGSVLSWITAASGGGSPVVSSVTGATILTATPTILLCNTTTAGFTVTLPTAIGNSGLMFRIKKADASANILTIATSPNTQTIDGTAASIQIKFAWDSLTLVSDGTNWFII